MVRANYLVLRVLLVLWACATSCRTSQARGTSTREDGKQTGSSGRYKADGIIRLHRRSAAPCRETAGRSAYIGDHRDRGCKRTHRKQAAGRERLEFSGDHSSALVKSDDGSVCMSMGMITSAYMIPYDRAFATTKGILAASSSMSGSANGVSGHHDDALYSADVAASSSGAASASRAASASGAASASRAASSSGAASASRAASSSRAASGAARDRADRKAAANIRAPAAQTKRAVNVLILDFHFGMRREMESVISNFRSRNARFQINVYSPPDTDTITCETRGLDIWAFCGESEIEKFLELSQEKSWLRNADVVMFSMPPVALQLFLRLNKTIVMLVAVPPEYGRQNLQAYERWHADIRRAATLRHVAIVSCSVYDSMYLRYFYGIRTMVIPVLGEYKGDSGLGSPSVPDAVVDGGNNETDDGYGDGGDDRDGGGDDDGDDDASEFKMRLSANIEAPTKKPHAPPASIGLFPQSSWKLDWPQSKILSGLRTIDAHFDIVETTGKLKDAIDFPAYDALVYLPYMRNTNLFIEAYRAAVPIFTPSLEYLVKLDQAECLMSNRVYWTNIPEPCDPAYPYSPAELVYSEYPVVTEPRSHAFWLAYSQHFRPDHPGIVYFDSPEDLARKLKSADLASIRAVMLEANARTFRKVNRSWHKVLTDLLDGLAALPGASTGLEPFAGPASCECDGPTLAKYQSRTRTLDNDVCPNPMVLDVQGMPGRHSCGVWETIPY